MIPTPFAAEPSDTRCRCCGAALKPLSPGARPLCPTCWAARHPKAIPDCCKRGIEQEIDNYLGTEPTP